MAKSCCGDGPCRPVRGERGRESGVESLLLLALAGTLFVLAAGARGRVGAEAFYL